MANLSRLLFVTLCSLIVVSTILHFPTPLLLFSLVPIRTTTWSDSESCFECLYLCGKAIQHGTSSLFFCFIHITSFPVFFRSVLLFFNANHVSCLFSSQTKIIGILRKVYSFYFARDDETRPAKDLLSPHICLCWWALKIKLNLPVLRPRQGYKFASSTWKTWIVKIDIVA